MSFSPSGIPARIIGLAPIGSPARPKGGVSTLIEACLLDLLVGNSGGASHFAERMCLWSPTEQLTVTHIPHDTINTSLFLRLDPELRNDLVHRPFLEAIDNEQDQGRGHGAPTLIVPLDGRVQGWLAPLPHGDDLQVLRFDRLMRGLFPNLIVGRDDYHRIWKLYDPQTSAPYHPASLIHDVFVAGRILSGVLSELPLSEVLAAAR
ncbi:hypothetical protein [Brytella acorum]|uniref:hypothetical protein n=1 Tax=Brytella acorum TaxID=2959299 RepID=UPI0025AE701F|nr:hypothetical protein [Brytella acorum]MDF3626175.1 hypothetical protein [Brytella acorum]